MQRRNNSGSDFALLQTLFDRHKMKRHDEKPKAVNPTGTKAVVVVYENPAVREHAVRFCDQMAEQHRSEVRLEITWWSFTFLEQPVMATDAARRAGDAELIVFALE